ncbi:hypothetical protein DOJK_01126 [Patescibacteria group bacterium]|nr:hypothetical protein DOJK_01126 [Patescibacteria group bacterium]
MALTDYISSDRQNISNEALRKNKPKTIQVYVEGFEDIGFWHTILNPYETPASIKFQIDSSGGKKNLIKLFDSAGDYLIICLDSDYDYLLPERSNESKKINASPYIFQTYAYSTENLKCYAESLSGVCVQATLNTEEKVNFSLLLEHYSSIIYPLFIWNLYFASIDDEARFSINDFSDVIKLNSSISLDNFYSVFNELAIKVQEKVNELEELLIESSEIENLIDLLEQRGLKNTHCYLFIHGHTLYNQVVLNLIKPVCSILKNEYRTKINSEQEKRNYGNLVKSHENALKSNYEFKDCFLFEKIQADIEVYLIKHIKYLSISF